MNCVCGCAYLDHCMCGGCMRCGCSSFQKDDGTDGPDDYTSPAMAALASKVTDLT